MEDAGHWDTLSVKDLFEELMAGPINAGLPSDHPVVFLIDALDEAAKTADRNRLLQLITSSFRRLPPHVRMVVTSRPYPEVVDRVKAAYHTYDLDPDRPENVQDLRAFVRHHLKKEVPPTALDAAVAAVMRNARGSYTYATAVLDDTGEEPRGLLGEARGAVYVSQPGLSMYCNQRVSFISRGALMGSLAR